jgi:inorganic pyrophosphatase
MNYIKDIKLREKDSYNVIIEIPKGTNKKYELVEPENEKVECVRKVIGKYPFYYGCFPETFAGDKDPLDMILLSNKCRGILDIVSVQPIGVIKTIDDGEVDDKVLVIANDEPIDRLDKLEKKALKFLKSYKGKKSKMILDETIYDIEEAVKIINQANKNYKEKFSKVNSNKNLSSF